MNKYILMLFAVLLLASACRKDEDIIIVEGESADYPDWTTETHTKFIDPNYDVVFNQTEVLRFDITIASDDWSDMQTNLASVVGSGGGPGGGGPGGGGASMDEDPAWFKCSFKYGGKEWYNVGVRYKGNSSLQSAYQSGNNKLSFKLDFDEFEDMYPLLKNQRFYGFKQLNLNNNFDDKSLMREKVAADLFRQFGLASAHTTFCIIYVDNGSGPKYYGVYTIVEEVDDTVLEDQFDDDNGNLYKPDGDAAAFSSGSYDEDEMEKKSNESEADYTDVLALYNAINSSNRTSDTTLWKINLEAAFNVDGFVKWLAANTVIQNWDTYGRMTHNFYLYNNPADNKLTWIPWDNNEALQFGKMGGALSFGMTEVGANWPLIRYIIDQPEYYNRYKYYLQKFVDEVFIASDLNDAYTTYYDLIRDYAYDEVSGYTYINSDSEFDQAVNTLKTHAQTRASATNSFLQ